MPQNVDRMSNKEKMWRDNKSVALICAIRNATVKHKVQTDEGYL